jgi:hypothetical protein
MKPKAKPKAPNPAAKKPTKPKVVDNGPDELDGVWDEEVAAAFQGLNPKQQIFLIEYLKCGVGSEAYRKSYNAEASDHLASVHGSRLVANTGIRTILTKFADRKEDAMFTVVRTYFDMTGAKRSTETGREVPDWKSRKDGADGLSRIFGLNAPEKVQDDRFTALLDHMKSKETP